MDAALRFTIFTLLLIILFCNCHNPSKAAEEPIQEPLEKLLPKGYVEYTRETGDLNGDGSEDMVIITRNQLEDSVSFTEEHPEINLKRPVLIFFGAGEGRYELAGRNDHVALPGFYAPDFFTGITITRNYFTIENQYGPYATYHTVYHTFKVIGNEIIFHRKDEATYEVMDSEKGAELQDSTITRANRKILFEEYNKL